MNFYDVLAAKNWDGGIPTINFFDLLFAQSMGGDEQWQTYEGTLPATINANGDDMRQYQIYGNIGGVGDDSGTAYGYKLDMATEKPIIYGFHINPNDPNSYTAVTYLEDAVGKTPAAMGSTAFSYGDWADTFFMPRPCMLKYDGTVDYYLNPNDYSQKADGTPSDYNNLAYGGNAMMEFPLIWYKFVQGAESGEGYFYCSNRKIDDSYKCWSNMDCDGNIIEHFYMPIYNGCTYDGKMRSISGLQLSPWGTTAYSASATYVVGDEVNYNGRMWKCITAVETAESFDPEKWEQFAFNGQTTGTEEINYAKANNITTKVEWYTDVLCDRQLINALLVLLSKSLDTQGAFGRGIETGSQAAKEAYVTGSLNDKGLFYGSSGSSTAVKVFGMENWWACVWHRTAGLVGAVNNIYKYKMTYSTADGSTANGYNTNRTGYLSVGNKPTTNNYIKKMQYGLWGCLPIETGSYSTQFFRDYWYDGTGYALFGGNAASGALNGAFYATLNIAVGYRSWNISSDLSCKPCRVGTLSKNFEAATVTTIYIGDTPLEKDEYVDYQAGKVFRRTAQIMPSAPAETKTSNGITVTCDGEGRYSISGTATSSASIYFGIPEFTTPISVEQGGQGTLSLFNTFNKNSCRLYFMLNASAVDDWVLFPINRTNTTYSAVGGKQVNGVLIQIASGNVINGSISPMFTNDSTLPSTYQSYFQPTDPPIPLPVLPTCEGTMIVDYAGQSVAQPEKVYLEYKGGT